MMKSKQSSLHSLLFCMSLLALAHPVSAQEPPPLETVNQVDLGRYAGAWYEAARLPNWFQDQCAGNVAANYKPLDAGNIEVINRCLDNDGNLDEAHGVARIVDASSNAKLEVSFVSVFGWNLFWGDYWILDLGKDYEYAVVGMPSRKYAWILSRTLQLPPEAWGHIRQVLVHAGYDPEQLVMTQHENTENYTE